MRMFLDLSEKGRKYLDALLEEEKFDDDTLEILSFIEENEVDIDKIDPEEIWKRIEEDYKSALDVNIAEYVKDGPSLLWSLFNEGMIVIQVRWN